MQRNQLLLALATLCLPLAAQGGASVGDQVPEFSFPRLINGDGRQSLSDFYGHPVVVEYWGRH